MVRLLTYYYIFILDWIGLVLANVLFAPMILNEFGMTYRDANITLGLLLAIFPLAQFVASPLLGEFSDRWGRRPVLLFSTLGSCIAFAITGWGVVVHSLTLLFVGRFFGGISAANVALSMAGVGAQVTDAKRGRAMSVFPVLSGSSWVYGPVIAYLLSLVSPSFPFWVVSVCFFVASVASLYLLEPGEKEEGSFSLTKSYSRLFGLLKVAELRQPFWFSMLALFAFTCVPVFITAFLVDRFAWKLGEVSWAYAYMSLWFTIGGLVAGKWILSKYKPIKAIGPPLLFQIVGLIGLAVLYNPWNLTWVFAFIAGGRAITAAGLFTYLSQIAGPKNQGKMFGLWGAAFAFVNMIAPPISGWLITYWTGLPFLFAAVVLAGATIWYWVWLKKQPC